mgnify:CR=1 FL=1
MGVFFVQKMYATLPAGVQIEISIPRPMRTLLFLAVVAGVVVWLRGDPRLSSEARAKLLNQSSSSIDAEGGSANPQRVAELTGQIMDTRATQALLGRREELLRYQVEVLQKEREQLGPNIPPAVEEEFRQSVEELTALIKDQKKAEAFLLTAFQELWDAEGRATQLAQDYDGPLLDRIALEWPVEPSEGVSAYFLDAAYEARFGFKHYALDIPTPQGTAVRAAADGIVEEVSDKGLGFNDIIVGHAGGFKTLYGHVSKFHVSVGQEVFAGQIIAESGGRPGTPGAGFSTGPHVHFGVSQKGKKLDPLPFLPARSEVDMTK